MFTASWLRRRSTLYSINPRALLGACVWVSEYVFCQHAFITEWRWHSGSRDMLQGGKQFKL
ncbi:hypothetical protein BYT27DRAFT_7197799 [Phlegmacium glaucopus]|nr:hypothetical protein BYT27DRAFT_7197799 [Phlegmacium glaucopus]